MTNMTTKHRSGSPASPAKWAVAEAKARFSEVIARALADGPQTITRKGKETVVVVAAAEWQLKTRRQQSSRVFRGLGVARRAGQNQAHQGWATSARSVSFLLDTNVVSEWVKPRPDRNVVSWMADVDEVGSLSASFALPSSAAVSN
jgi:prevent-host-death family protein